MQSTGTRSNFLQVTLNEKASAGLDAVRYDQHLEDLALKSATGHTHNAGSIADFNGAVDARVLASLGGSTLVRFQNVSSIIQGSLLLKSGGGLRVEVDGYGVDFGDGVNQVARGNHSHGQLHDPVTLLSASQTIDVTIDAQKMGFEVRRKSGGGLTAPSSAGLEIDFGAGPNQAARGDHTHGQLHNPVSAVNTQSLRLDVVGAQVISGTVLLDPSPSATRGKLGVGPNGVYVQLGSGADQAAAGDHLHSDATPTTSGFLSSVDKAKLDQYGELIWQDGAVPFVRHDVCPAGRYVGGRRQWGMAMQVVNWHYTCLAPVGVNCLLGLEVAGVVVETLAINAGSEGSEANGFVTLTNRHINASTMVRVLMLSGTSNPESAPSTIDVCLSMRPSLAVVTALRLNAGGLAVAGGWSADGSYSGGLAGSTVNPIDVTGLSGAAPQAVYQTHRYKYNDNLPLSYTITGLPKGLTHLVNLHFAEFVWTSAGQQKMLLEVIGETTSSLNNFDILAATSGVQNKAVLRNFTVVPDSNGQIVVKLTPLLGTGGDFNLSINGIELIPLTGS